MQLRLDRMVLASLALIGGSWAQTSAAWSMNVAQGCAAPASASGHNTFYVDPVRGSMSGDGSQARPWHTLAEVFDVRNRLLANAPDTYLPGYGIIKAGSAAPIKSGDTILLLSGNHGSPSLQGYFGDAHNTLYGYNNSSFITVAAAPGQVPVVSQLSLLGASKWVFQGLVFQSLQNVPGNNGRPFSATASGVSDYYLVTTGGPNSDIIFTSDVFQSQANTSTWTTNDWLQKRASGLLMSGGSCFTVTNNLFQNIGFAISTAAQSNVLIQGNTINNFSDDGIDYGSNNLVIDRNQITNSIEDNDGFHRDGMQGTLGPNDSASNIQITNNYVNNQTTKLVAAANLQGIDAFDGSWQNLLIANNVVVTNSYHGITFYGATNIEIVNNTVIGAYSDDSNGICTWINVNPSKGGAASQNIIIRNNLASYFVINGTAVVDHNILATLSTSAVKYYSYNSGVTSGMLASNVFASFNPKMLSYDMRLLNSPAADGGVNVQAPTTDIRGLSRGTGNTTSMGAFIYGGSAYGAQNSNLTVAALTAAVTANLTAASASRLTPTLFAGGNSSSGH